MALIASAIFGQISSGHRETYKSGCVYFPSGAGYKDSYILSSPDPWMAYALNLLT